MVSYRLEVSDDVWEQWKETVPRHLSLREVIVLLLEREIKAAEVKEFCRKLAGDSK